MLDPNVLALGDVIVLATDVANPRGDGRIKYDANRTTTWPAGTRYRVDLVERVHGVPFRWHFSDGCGGHLVFTRGATPAFDEFFASAELAPQDLDAVLRRCEVSSRAVLDELLASNALDLEMLVTAATRVSRFNQEPE
jgi:hypothetical protein